MNTVNIYNAKTNLSKLIEQVQSGKEIIISKFNNPVAVLSAYKKPTKRVPGALAGRIKMSEDFDVLPESFMKYFS